MIRSDEDGKLRRLNFSDLKFLHDFLKHLHGTPKLKSLSEAARRLDISRDENLHHRLKRVLGYVGYLGNHPPINDGIRITEEGRKLEAVLNELLRTARPLLSSKMGTRSVVRLAMPEVMTNGPFTDLLRKINKQAWAADLDLEVRRFPPRYLEKARREQKGHFDLVMTLSGTDVKRDKPSNRSGANLRRVLLVLNNDELVGKSRIGSWPDEDALHGRPVYLAPTRLWPGFPEHGLEMCNIHHVASFDEAHAYALGGRKALAAAHPELLDEIVDELCDTIPLGPEAGRTRLKVHMYPGANKLIKDVHELMTAHLVDLGKDATRAEDVNKWISRYDHVAYTSIVHDECHRHPDGADNPWHWKYASLSNFHVTALGHLKGHHQSGNTKGESFHLTGRIMHGKDGWNHVLWNSVDDETEPGDPAPKVEQCSVNLLFNDDRLARGLPLVGLWSGRISGPVPWVPACGVVLIATTQLGNEDLDEQLKAFRKTLHLWQDPPLPAKAALRSGLLS